VFAVDLGRPLRADGRRNRALLLEAARAVFQRDGLAAQMDAIAAEAGLGVGTLYRHFPTREALIAVLSMSAWSWHRTPPPTISSSSDELARSRWARSRRGVPCAWAYLHMV